MDKLKRDLLASLIQIEFNSLYESLKEERPKSQMCLIWSMASVKVLRKHGYPAQIQAGSAQWRFRPRSSDDGVTNDHFGYVFDPRHYASLMSMAMGRLPEMHVWTAIVTDNPKKSAIIDMTAPYFKELAEWSGFDWSMPNPPDYLWVTLDEFEVERYQYIPHPAAITYTYSKIKEVVQCYGKEFAV